MDTIIVVRNPSVPVPLIQTDQSEVLRKQDELKKLYNSFFYNLFNLSHIFDLKDLTDMSACQAIIDQIKLPRNQKILRKYNCSTFTFGGKSYELPPLNREITLETDYGFINFTLLSQNELDISAIRIAEPIMTCISKGWGLVKILEVLP